MQPTDHESTGILNHIALVNDGSRSFKVTKKKRVHIEHVVNLSKKS